MDPVAIDYTGAVAAYTPWIVGLLQVVKQSPKINNAHLPYYAVLLGIALALSTLAAAGRLVWTPAGLIADSTGLFRALVEGAFAGAVGPISYDLQARLPFKLLTDGPDNHPAQRGKGETGGD